MIKPVKIINLKKLKEIHTQQLKAYTKMLPKDDVVFHVDDIHNIIWIIFFEKIEDFKLNTSLILIFLLILDYLQSDFNFVLMIETFQCL